MNQRTIFLRLLRLAAPFWKWMALAALLGALTIASSIALLAASAYIIARATLRPSIADLQVAIVGVRFFGIARGVFRYLERLVSHEANFRLLARLRVWFYTALEPLAPARLAHHRGGDLLARIVADIDTLEHFYVRVLAPPVVALLIALLMGIFLSAYDVRLALAVLAVLALAGVGVPLLTRYLSRDAGQAMAQTRGELNAALLDGIQGSADVIAFGQQAAQLARIRGINRQLSRWQRRMARIRGLDAALGALLVNLAAALVLALATPLVRAGQIEGVDVAVLALATMASFESVLGLPMAFQYLGSSLAAGRRLFEIVDEKPVLAAQDYPLAQSTPSNFDLVFEDVTFRYAADSPPALDSIGFTLRQGRRLAIVGASGAGKSTLVNLLLRFWDYEQGFITLGGRDIRDYDPEHLRNWIAVVSQNTYLFNTTIRENILLGRQNASEAEMVEAAQQAQIHDFITGLPDGYNTWVGEQGLRLSGGERQRIAIARALLKDAPVLALDEATAGLDAVTERNVMAALDRLMEGRTVLMITHRLTGLQAMDEILVLHEGKLAERGTHAGLVQSQGLYFKMWALQNESLR
jgi:ATP-binding cassette subfamily C protein CydC